ncbi:deoxycytidine triphosphate deaminase [Salinarchaeum sp. Harcht-Bsk1]|uniref:deoxycytidine triphosphate deaminase n=1 Tax=Salinarchaeum sp. Harcht-Bsk1 TaxID=1333523 RepID=UPI00034227B0|nr:deoxycytidine triphosphate deaminase [Salinarchaeum sp. Harcht-Bsk1]AGN01378.1 deoxycytidine triphosphate deaminase [Salinarchaeum sp. Harcht-Bsk1]
MSITDHVEDIVHEETQVHRGEAAIDLTATEIYEIAEPGRVDFGGGELEPADLQPHDRVWRNEADDYQWWHLDAGQYLLEFNETVVADDRLVLQPRDAILERGASHPTLHVESVERIPLAVGGAGLRLKENARVSTLLAP